MNFGEAVKGVRVGDCSMVVEPVDGRNQPHA